MNIVFFFLIGQVKKNHVRNHIKELHSATTIDDNIKIIIGD